MSTTTTVRGKGLAAGELGLVGSVSIGVSSTAPVYSLAATLGFIVLAVGEQAPAALLLAFLPMLFIALAYRELNSRTPDCGTTFTWASQAFGRFTGWMGGWALAMSGVFVLANLAQVSGDYLWRLLNPDWAENTALVTVTGVVFIALMTWINLRGIDFGEKMQRTMVILQYAALGLFVVFALVRIGTGDAFNSTPVRLDWFNPFAFDSVTSMAYAVLLALFIYWGWDSTLALNEETRNPRRTPGRAALISALILLVTYLSVAAVVMSYAGTGTDGLGLGNADNAGDVLYAVSDAVMGPWAWVVVLAVLISAASATQTTILPTARGTLSMAAQGALPERFGRVDPKFLAPSYSTTLMGLAATAYFLIMTAVSQNLLADSIASLSLLIAFYYGMTGFACVWFFRRELKDSARNLFFKGIFPLLGALMMTAAFVISAVDMVHPDYGSTVIFGIGGTFVVGIGTLLLGAVLMIVWYTRQDRRQRAAA